LATTARSVIASAQITAGNDGDGIILTGLFALAATDAFGIVHDTGFAVHYFKKGVRTTQHALKTAGAFFSVYFYCHLKTLFFINL
jgi:hypothetical protein